MALKLRLARHGTKKRPYYRIVVADSRAPRDGRFIERIGSYNPMLPKDSDERVKLDLEKCKEWLGKGARPTDRVARFLGAAGLWEWKPGNNPNKGKPGAKAAQLAEEKIEKAKARKEAEAEAKEAAKAAAAEAKEVAKTAAAEAEKAPAEEVPAEEAPAPVAETPAEETKPEEAKSEEVKPEEAAADEKPAESAPQEEPKTEEPKAEDAPAPEAASEAAPADSKAAGGFSDAVDAVVLIDGIGPKGEEALAESGITKLTQLVAMSAEDITALEEKIGKAGIVAKQEWIEQAKEMIDGQEPRSQTDKDLAAKMRAEAGS